MVEKAHPTAPDADVDTQTPTEALAVVQATEAPLAAVPGQDGGARAVQAYLRAQLSPRSRQNALDALRRLTRVITRDASNDPVQIPWTSFGYEQVTTVRTMLYELTRRGEITPGTANLTLSHLRGLIRTMYGMGLVSPAQHELTHSNAMKNVPGKREARGRAISGNEERELRSAAQSLGGYKGAMLDTAIVLAIGAGLRREEVAGLTVAGLEPGTMKVLGKGNKARPIPIDAQMQAAIDFWLEERTRLALPHGGLFCSPNRPGKRLSPWSFWDLVRTTSHIAFGDRKPCDKECRCLKVVTGPHDFRRTLATRMLGQGDDIVSVRAIMGHESIETTSRYDKRDVEAIFERRRKMRIIA